MTEPIFADNIRDLLKHLIGQRLLEITGEDQEDRDKGHDRFCELMFENGDTVKFYLAKDKSSYKGGSPISFSDPDKESNDLFEDNYFHPTPEEKVKGGWIAVIWHCAEGKELHVVPVNGPEHFLDEACWCKPIKKFRDDNSWYWGHNEA